MSEEQTFYEFSEAKIVLEDALENFWKKVENDERALIDEFNDLLVDVTGWNDLVITEK